MTGPQRYILMGVAAVVGLSMMGCGGTGTKVAEVAGLVPIAAYVGDGHQGTKPLPDFVNGAGGLIQPQAVSSLLTLGAQPITATVPAGQINWFRLPNLSVPKWIVVTLQPTANENSDLYLMKSNGGGYNTGAGCLGFSTRPPTGSTDTVKGYAPDWVAHAFPANSALPAAQVAVFGLTTGATTKHFTIEADAVTDLVVNGATAAKSVAGGNSDWYRWVSNAAPNYTLTLTAVSNIPDLYQYLANSKGPFGNLLGSGSQVINTPPGTVFYERIYGFGSGANKYQVKVTAP